MTWVTDLSHFIDARTGRLPVNVPGPARRLMDYLTRIVAAATAGEDGHVHAIDQIKCRRRPGRRACPGMIEYHMRADERITWQCPHCGDNGIISNWQSTVWDRRSVQPTH
jgi:hypothetical protein